MSVDEFDQAEVCHDDDDGRRDCEQVAAEERDTGCVAVVRNACTQAKVDTKDYQDKQFGNQQRMAAGSKCLRILSRDEKVEQGRDRGD